MRTSLTLSASIHLAVLAVILLNFSSGRTPDAAHPVVVEILLPSDLSRMKAGSPDKSEAAAAPAQPKTEEKKAESQPTAPDPKPAEKPAKKQAVPPPPKPRASRPEPAPAKSEARLQESAAPQPEAPPEARAKAKAAPAPLPPKRQETKPEKGWEATAEHRPSPSPRPEPEREAARNAPAERDRIANLINQPAQPAPEASGRPRFDANRIAALLNRDPDAGTPPVQEGPREPWRRPSSFQDQAATGMAPDARERSAQGNPSARDDRVSANEIDAFIGQVSRCWTPPVGGLGAGAIVVRLHIELREDGTLARPPQVANRGNSPFFTPAADSAVRAVLQCEPYRMPPEKFSHWRDMLLNFDPRQMYGG